MASFSQRSLRLFVFLIAIGAAGRAQVTNATLTGIVSDPSGAPISGAKVTATNTGTNQRHETSSASDGIYTIPALTPGQYQLTVEQAGFKMEVLSGIVLQVSQEARMNVTMQVGQVNESVTVSSAAPLVNSENASIGSVISESKVVDLPLNGRNFMQLTLLTGGINEGSSTNSKAGILNKGFAPAAAGVSAYENNYLLDGADNTEAFFKSYNVAPSVDAVQEFRIQIGQYSAEFGAGGGAVINVVTKSGTNAFHGAAWEFVRNNIFDARNFFLKPNQEISPLHQNQFGVAAGGPIAKNRTFIFGDFDLTRIHQGAFASANVPTGAQLGGDFSGLSKTIRDPLTHSAFPGNVIPADRISPISSALAKYYPAPNNGNPLQNYSSNLASILDSNNYLIKVDQILTPSETLMGRYANQSNDRRVPGAFPLVGGMLQPQGFQNALLNLTSAFSPTLLNEAHFSYSRTINRTKGQNTGDPIAADAGVPFAGTSGFNAGFPESIGIGTSAISGLGETQPWYLTVNTFQWYDGVTVIRGSHSLKAGVDIRRVRADAATGTHQNNDYTFSGQFSGDGFSDFLLGAPSSETLVLLPNAAGRFRATQMAYYLLDDWKATPNLTLNLGLRYEYSPPAKELSGLTPIFDPTIGGLRFPNNNTTALPWYQANRPDLPVGLLNRDTEFTPDRNNLAPRIGLAWRPFHDEKTVIRSGYGFYYASPQTTNIIQNAQTGPPSQYQAIYNSAVTTPTLTYGGQIGVPPDQALKTATFGVITGPEAHFLNAYTQQWSFSVARQVKQNIVFEAQYMGSKTTHLENVFDYNATLPAASLLALRVPYSKWGRIFGFSSGANSNFNALLLSAEKRLSYGLSFKLSYSYSKALSSNGGSMAGGNISAIQNPLNLRLENGPTADNLPQRFVGYFNYELPFGPGKLVGSGTHGLIAGLIRGWSVNGIATAEDGMFFSPTVGIQNCNSAYQVTCRPDLSAYPLLGGSGIDTPRWALSAFDWPNDPAHSSQTPRFGDAAPNSLQGNGLFDVDLSLRKEIPVNERVHFEFRLESFNALNHTNFATPTTAVDSASFGRTFSAASPRLNQLGLKLYW